MSLGSSYHGGDKNGYEILICKRKRKYHLKKLDRNKRIILKLIL